MESRSPEQALLDAIEVLGSQTAMAELCGISQPAVHKWVRDGKQLPAEYCLRVEVATGISRHDLRPDLYPREDAPARPPAGSPPLPAGGPASADALEGVRS